MLFRKVELPIYAIVMVVLILRYSVSNLEEDRRTEPTPRRSAQAEEQQAPPVFLPDDALLPEHRGDVLIELDNKLHNSVGTAFSVDQKGTYVTARHVVDGCREVFFVNSRGGLERVASVKSTHNRDFAVIKAKGSQSHFLLEEFELPRGSEGYMMGYPQGKPADVRATVIGKAQMRSRGRYRADEPVYAWVERERRPGFFGTLGGLSGGPVLDANGTVVGTAVAEGQRRGRIFTTHPHVFFETGLLRGSREGRTIKPKSPIDRANYHSVGAALRANGTIRQVYCRVK